MLISVAFITIFPVPLPLGCSPRSSTVDFIGPDTQCFQSPGYDKKNMGYKPGDKCYWQLQVCIPLQC